MVGVVRDRVDERPITEMRRAAGGGSLNAGVAEIDGHLRARLPAEFDRLVALVLQLDIIRGLHVIAGSEG